MDTLEFYFDYSCPYAFLASLVVERAASLRPATLRYAPMLLGGVFRAHGTPQNLMGQLSAEKARHNLADMHRWAELLGVGAAFAVPAEHPFRTVEALRATLATGIDPRVVAGFYRAYWMEGAAISERAVLERVLREAGHDAEEVLTRASSQAIKDELRARTEQAISLGIFGAPAWVVHTEGQPPALYWGLDRLPFVTREGVSATYGLDEVEYHRAMSRAATLDLYWDFSSPFAYLGSTQAEALAARTGATLRWRPMLLGGLFRAIGQEDAPLLSWSDAKRRHSLLDMQRWADHYGVPFRFPEHFPVNSVKALRCWLALPLARRDGFRKRTFEAYWGENRNIAEDSVLAELLGEDAREVLEKTQEPAIKQQLIDATQGAKEQGVFGAPTWVVNERELFWGQDRIPLVERALLAT